MSVPYRCPQFLRTNCAYHSIRCVITGSHKSGRIVHQGLPFSPEALSIKVNETMGHDTSTTTATAATSAAANDIESKTASVDWLNHSGLLRALCGLSVFIGINQLLGVPSNGATLTAVFYLYWAAYMGDHLADCRYECHIRASVSQSPSREIVCMEYYSDDMLR